MWALVGAKLAIAEPIVQFLSSNGILNPRIFSDPQQYRTVV